jgi:hypothetical protein
MPTIRLVGEVDQHHRLVATVPPSIAPGTVKLLVLLDGNDEDDAGSAWSEGVAREWQDELSDPREDLYTLADGVPVDESR